MRESTNEGMPAMKERASMTYRQAIRIVRVAGMSVENGLAFTVCGGQLVSGEDAPDQIKRMNGWPVQDVASELSCS